MAALSTFRFKGYTLRPAVLGMDGNLAREWTRADPEHRHTTPYKFWFEGGELAESYLLLDRAGPVFFFKMVRVEKDRMELHIQFPPASETPTGDLERKRRILEGMAFGLGWLEEILLQRAIKEIFFDSKSPGLVKVCEDRLGFVAHGERLVKTLKTRRLTAE